jgi:beta-alanine--pyruvate transaminase
VLVPPKGYLQKLRELCTKHGILLIFDEVITGFGRTGSAFGAQEFGVTPDIITCAKGLTNGAVPMGAVFAKRAIHDTFMQGPPGAIELFHGYTYSAHPIACAAGLAAQKIYLGEALFERAKALAPYWSDAVHSLRGRRNVVDLRAYGLVAGIELGAREGAPGARGYDALVAAFNAGLLIRTTGDTIAMSPPLIIERKDVDRIFETLAGIIDRLD